MFFLLEGFAMKKMSVLCLFLMLTACVTTNKVAVNNSSVVTACADIRPKACTREFRPVCGVGETGKKVQSFANACNACSDENILGYTAGECR